MTERVKLQAVPLWSERWPREMLEDYAETKPRAYARGMELKVHTAGEKTFPSFPRCEIPGARFLRPDEVKGWVKVLGVDLSSKKRPGNAIVCVGMNPTSGRIHLLDAVSGAWKSPETVRHIGHMDRRWDPLVVGVENNGYQAALEEWVDEYRADYPFWRRIEAVTTDGSNKMSEDVGLPALEIDFDHRAWVFPVDEYGPVAIREEKDPEMAARRVAFRNLAHEFHDHPFAATTDGVMATWFCRRILDRYRRPVGTETISNINAR